MTEVTEHSMACGHNIYSFPIDLGLGHMILGQYNMSGYNSLSILDQGLKEAPPVSTYPS